MVDDEVSIPDSPEREFTITRIFAAPRDLVWRAWTDAEHFALWFGPRGYSVPPESVSMDVRPGGSCDFIMVSEADGSESHNRGTFLEVVEPERLVFRTEDTGMVVTITMTDLGDNRTTMAIRVVGELYGEPAIGGWQSSLDKLADVFAAG